MLGCGHKSSKSIITSKENTQKTLYFMTVSDFIHLHRSAILKKYVLLVLTTVHKSLLLPIFLVWIGSWVKINRAGSSVMLKLKHCCCEVQYPECVCVIRYFMLEQLHGSILIKMFNECFNDSLHKLAERIWWGYRLTEMSSRLNLHSVTQAILLMNFC